MDASLITPGPPWLPADVRDSVGSTNAVLAADPRSWRVVTAEEQTQGRGRLDRAWTTTPGTRANSSRACAGLSGSRVSTWTASLWETKTGIRTAVDEIRRSGR